MGIRFRRSKKVGPFRINLSKRGVGISGGVKGARIGVGPRGVYRSLGIPGTGIYAFDYLGKGKNQNKTGKGGETQENVDPLPLPAELKVSSLPTIILIASIVILFSNQIVGIAMFFLATFWLYKITETEKYKAKKAFLKGKQALKKEEFSLALGKFKETLSLVNSPQIQIIVARLSLSEKEYDTAIDNYKRYLLEEPADTQVKLELAHALISNDKSRQAIPLLQDLPSEFKESLPYIILLGQCYLNSDQLKEALHVLERGPVRGRKVTEERMEFWYLLGKSYLMDGQLDKAKRHLGKVFAEENGYKDVAELLRKSS